MSLYIFNPLTNFIAILYVFIFFIKIENFIMLLSHNLFFFILCKFFIPILVNFYLIFSIFYYF